MLPASVGAAVLCMATLLAKKTPVMINWTVGPRNLEHVQALTGIEVVLTSMKFVDRLGETDLGSLEELLVFVEDLKSRIGLPAKLRAVVQARRRAGRILRDLKLGQIKDEDEAVILFTSGSETQPKGVPLTHRNILTNLRDAFEVSDYKASDVILSFLPPFHSFGFVITTVLPLVSGIKIAYSPDPTDSAKLARAIPFWKASLVYGTPTFLSGILSVATEDQLATIRGMGGGAERFPESLFEKVKALTAGAYVVEGYGITECGPILTINRLDQSRQGVGPPFPSVELLIVDPETYAPLEPGCTGLILARGDNIFSGYLGEDAPNPFREIDGKRYYVTGDLGFLNENGALVLSGRKKRFVKVAGEMISLPALEAALVLRWPQDENGPIVALESLDREDARPVICLFTTIEITLEEANGVLKQCGFSNVGKITHLQKIKAIPVLGTGKTDYRSLKSMVAKVLD